MKANTAAPQGISLERDLTSTGGFFAGFATAVTKGDAFVKLSLLWWGAGYAPAKRPPGSGCPGRRCRRNRRS